MNHEYDALRALYRAAAAEEHATRADRHAVRMALVAATAAGVHATAAGAAASVPSMAGGASAIGVKGVVPLLFGGKFLGGLLVGAALGTAVSTTAYVVQPKKTPAVTVAKLSEAKPSPTAQRGYRALPELGPAAHAALPDIEGSGDSGEPPALGVDQGADSAASLPMQAAPTNTSSLVRMPSSRMMPLHAVGQSAAAVPSNADKLAEETEALAKVQAALNRKEPQLALSLLDEQDRSFSAGQLAEERAAAHVLALCAAGRKAEAEQARARFVAVHPTSPLAKRVKQSCNLP